MLGSAFVVETDYNAESIVKLYDALVAARQEMYDTMTAGELSSSGLYKQVDEWIGKMQKDVEAYKKAIEDVANYSAELSALNYNFDEITDFTKFKAERDKFIEDLKKLDAFKDKSQEEIEAIADAYISKTSDTSGEFLNKITAVDQLAERFGETYRSAIEKAYEGLSSGELAALLDESNTKLKEQFEAMIKDGVPAAEALRMLGKEYKNAALDSLLLSKGIKDQLEELDYSEEAYIEFVDQLRKENKVLDENISLAKEMALVNIRMNKGLADLGENFKDLKLVLQDNKRNTSEFAAALEQMQGIMKNILNLESGDLLSDDFYTSAANLKLMEQAANGNLDAIEKLRQAAGNDILAQVKVNVDDEAVLQAISDLDKFIDNYPVKDLEVGAQLQDAEFINKLNKLVEDSKMTTEQVQAYLNSMGYDPEITETKPVKQKTTHWGSYPEPIYDSDGSIKEIKAHPYKWESEDEIQVPIIKSVTYNKPDKKTINFSNTSAGKAAKASGGSKSKPKKEDKIENNKDRYHDIEIDLKKVANEMQKVEDAQDKLVGQDLINNLQKQYNLLNKEIDLTAQKIGIAKEEQDDLRARLANKGVMFNSDGTIANYAQAYDKQLAYVNSIIDKYNAMDAKGQEAYQETLDKAMDDWEKFLDNIDAYDDLITDKIPGLEADIRKALDQQIEIKIEAFEYEIGIRLDMSEAERDWNEFKTRIIDGIKEDDILGNAKSKLKDFSTYYNVQGTGEIDATTTHVNKILQQLHQMDADQAAGVYGEKYSYTNAQGELVTIDYNNRKQALEDLKEYYTNLMESMTNLQDLSEEIHQSYLDMMDETQEKFDEQLDTYSRLGDLISHDMNLTSLLFGDDAYSLLADFYKKQKENSLEQLDFQRQQLDFWKAQMDAAEEGSEEWKNAKEKWEEAIET